MTVKIRQLFLIVFFISGLMSACCSALYAQGINTEFGQNRVQYHDYEWSFIESANFKSYFYQGGQDLGKFALSIAEKNLSWIEKKLEYKLNNKIEIMVYHNISDLKQTNIGQGFENKNTGGVTPIIGNKIFVHYNGDHRDLEQQINEGIGKVFVENMVFGGNLQEIIQNAVLLNLPSWFVDGLVSYVGREWSTKHDDRLRKGIQEGSYDNFNKLQNEQAAFAGHSLWHYIAETYGPSAIPNLLYLTRINRSVESGFLFVLGGSVKTIIQEWRDYYSQLYAYDLQVRNAFPEDKFLFKIKQKKEVQLGEVKMSNSGKYIAYAVNVLGQYKVYLYNTETGDKKVLLKKGFKSHTQPADDVYPLIAWAEKSHKLCIIYERRDQILLQYHDIDRDEVLKEPITKFQQVLDVAFTDNDKKLLLSAVRKGQCDLFSYFIPNTKVVQITNDFYDDLAPSYAVLAGRRGVLFSSNRLDDTLRREKLDTILPVNQFDLFFLDLEQSNSSQIIRLTNSPLSDEWAAKKTKGEYFSYLSDYNGIYNTYMAELDSSLLRTDQYVYFQDSMVVNPSYPLDSFQQMGIIDSTLLKDVYLFDSKRYAMSNFGNNILSQDVGALRNQIVYATMEGKQYNFYLDQLPDDPASSALEVENTAFRNQMENKRKNRRKKKDKVKTSRLPGAKPANKQQSGSSAQQEKKKKEKPSKPELSVADEVLFQPGKEDEEASGIPDKTLEEEADSKQGQLEDHESTELLNEDFYFQTEFDDVYDLTIDRVSAEEQDNAKQAREAESQSNATASTKTADNVVPSKAGNNSINPYPDMVVAPKYKRTRIRPYDVRFGVDEVVTQFDNSILFTPYESYTAGGNVYTSPNLNALMKVGATDLFEDYRIIGGFRLPLGLDGSEYFLDYHSFKRRLDKRFMAYRKVTKEAYRVTIDPDSPGEEVNGRIVTNLMQMTLSWPFDITSSLRMQAGYRGDRIYFSAEDLFSLALRNNQENLFNLKFEFVYDNSYEVALNIRNGTRFKVYNEFYKPFRAYISDNDLDVSFKDTGWLGVLGCDFRHYQRLHKQIVWASRFTAGKSYGTRKLLYYMGGVENWLRDPSKQFNQQTPINQDANYLLQTITANLRGFQYNIRNGSSHALLNTEVRVPLFSYLINSPIRSELIRNFQIVGFLDAGTAWEGWSPFTEDNRYYTVQVPSQLEIENTNAGVPVVATVNYFRNPIVYGYGVGFRTKLLGYFVKMDMAYGSDSGAKTSRTWFISLGTDF